MVRVAGSFMRIMSLVRKELEVIVKDRMALIVLILLPTLITFSLGATQFRVLTPADYAKVAVIDHDTSEGDPHYDFSQAFFWDMVANANDSTCIVFPLPSEDLAYYLLWQGDIDAIVVIPFGFESHLASNRDPNAPVPVPAYVNVTLDGTDLESQGKVIDCLTNAIADFKVEFNFTRDEVLPAMTAVMGPTKEQGFDLRVTVPLIIPLLLIGGTMILTSQCIVGDVPLRRLLLTPASKSEAIIAKTIAYLVTSLFQIQLIMGILILVYNYQPAGPYFQLVLCLLIIAFFGIVLGIFISVVSNSRLQANQYFIFAFLSLLVIELAVPVADVRNANPLHMAREAIVNIASRGLPFYDAMPPILGILAVSLAFFVSALAVFSVKKTLV
nr:ABC transporter permease [Candidatus Bathyarchaeota archaeon]